MSSAWRQQTASLSDNVAELDALRKAGSPHESLQALSAQITLQLIKLRKTVRATGEEGESIKLDTLAMKASVDQHHMQLQSHLYEKNHYNKEIAACRSFR